MEERDPTLNAALQGQEVTAITFVHDYFQIQLSDATINIYWWPRIVSSEATYRFAEPGFAVAARGLISQTIRDCQCSADEFVLMFSNRAALHVAFDQEDAEGPEAVSVQTSGGAIWVAP